MPLPTKRKGESDDDFIDRCMADGTMQKEYPNQEQRHAVCRAQLEKKSAAAVVDPGFLAELQAEVWAMEPRHLEAFLTTVQHRVSATIIDIEAARQAPQLEVRNGRAIITIRGVLLRDVPWWFTLFGLEATSYRDVRRQVLEAGALMDVKAVHLEINSPGGAVGGINEALEPLFALRQTKQLTARIDEMGASAAYWLAATAQEIVAEPNAQVGSIGVYTVLIDSSVRATREGFTVHVIRGGDLKGAGIAGAPISEEQLANHRLVIEDLRGNFIRDVAEGRALSAERVTEWATGAIWLAARAQQFGLIDGVIERTTATETERNTAMEQDSKKQEQGPDIEALQTQASAEGRAAEQAKLKAFREAFPDDLEFALTSYDAGMTLEQAQQMHGLQAKRLENAQTPTPAKTEGAEAVAFTDSEGDQAGDHEDFLTKARKRADARQISMTQAMQELAAEEPQLHEAYLEQCRQQARPVRGDGVQRLERSGRGAIRRAP